MEKQAVISLMVGIIEADGWIDDEEIEFAQDVLDAIECTEEDFELGQDMPLLPALVIVKNLTEEQKSVVSDVISATIVADRIITLEEAVVFDYVSELTGITASSPSKKRSSSITSPNSPVSTTSWTRTNGNRKSP